MKNNQGFVMRIVLIVIALVAVKYYFHIDIVEWYNSESGQKYAGWIWTMIKDLYFWVDSLFRKYL